jgi:hypothetical protein
LTRRTERPTFERTAWIGDFTKFSISMNLVRFFDVSSRCG